MKSKHSMLGRTLVLLVTILGSVALFSGRVNAQNLLQDGGFEFGVASPGNTYQGAGGNYGAWNKSGTLILGTPYGPVDSYEGVEALYFGSGGNVSQTISTTIGVEYVVSFAANGLASEGGRGMLIINNGSSLATEFISPADYRWGYRKYVFTANATQTTIRFQRISGDPVIDDVRVEVRVDPENLLQDGSFEFGLTSGPNTYFSRTTYGEWSAVGSPTTYLFGMPNGTLPPYDGSEAMLIGNGTNPGFVKQSFPTLIGQKYWVSLGVNSADGWPGSVRVTTDSQPALSQVIAAPGGNVWVTSDHSFVASGATTTLTIQNVSGYSVIDDVRASTAPFDNALQFDGVDDFASLGTGVNLANSSFTVELWAKRADANLGQQFMVSQGVAGANNNLHIGFSNNRLKFAFYANDLISSPVYTDQAWHHYAFIYDANTGQRDIYRDGVIVAGDAVLPNYQGSGVMYLGQNLGANRFHGQLDEVRIWNVARTESEVRANLDQKLAGNEPGLVAYHRMDEGTGTVLVDATSNTPDGSLINGTTRVGSTVPELGLATVGLKADPGDPDGIIQVQEGYNGGGVTLINPPTTFRNYTLMVTDLFTDIVSGLAPGVDFSRTGNTNHLTLVYYGEPRSISTSGEEAAGLRLNSIGSRGANGTPFDGISEIGDGGAGAVGYSSGKSSIESYGNIATTGVNAPGILAISQAGDGGNGGEGGFISGNGGNAGGGGNSTNVLISGQGTISTTSSNSYGVLAISRAGQGGTGGEGHGAGSGGDGGVGGLGGDVSVLGNWNIVTEGNNAVGMGARSVGGAGGRAGSGGWIAGDGGDGGSSGHGGSVQAKLLSDGAIDTSGTDAHGIFAQSVGGFAGSGGTGDSLFSAAGGNGGSAGDGGEAYALNEGMIVTRGRGANAVFAESIGGGGGSGGSGSGLFNGGGGDSKAGGNGGLVIVENYGSLETENQFARGIFAQSVGGSGGNGSTAAGLFYSVGGAGGTGGTGEVVTVYNAGSIVTAGDDSVGLFAQSVGGGGGTGGGAASVGSLGSVSVGGRGGGGGNGATVLVESTSQGTIETTGDRSHGIFAQSVGGGGGNGGFAVAAAGGSGFAIAVGSGGDGGVGGDGSNVVVVSDSNITTGGTNAHGIVAQSVGGGGGSGGFSIAVAGGGMAGALSIGGGGGGGGQGDEVSLTSTGDIWTQKDRSYGLFAQSVGGGGGDGGFSIAGAIGGTGLAAGLGGSGGDGGDGSGVVLESGSYIVTEGADAHGIVAQSVGGGGGSGGFNISASGGGGALSAGLGGAGGAGGSADTVTVDNWNTIQTFGSHAYGLLAQSVGGGGGDGGFSIAGSLGKGPALAFSMGGTGGIGGTGAAVDVLNDGDIYTDGDLSYGIMAQSVGGGGGSGGFSVSAALSAESGGLGFSMGGEGGSGVEAGSVIVDTIGNIETTRNGSHAILAQSVGGGGGAGGFSGSLAGGFGAGAKLGVSIGGGGGGGGSSDVVTVINDGELVTSGDGASGIYAQSIGGGGGDGGTSLSASFGTSPNAVNMSVAIGGGGGSGGVGSDVVISNFNLISTYGSNYAHGIFAQSIGGGGGNGGFSASGTLSTSTNAKQISVSMGGSGGTGNAAGVVSVLNEGLITTDGDDSVGVYAQSVGGGGGNGGSSFSGSFSGSGSKTVAVSLGGDGGIGGDGNQVNVVNNGEIATSGERSRGIFAHSIGGGGGNGGWSAALNMTLAASNKSTQVSVSVGGKGGAGGIGGDVSVNGNGNVFTIGSDAEGIFAQSVGGGGGNGGASLAGSAVLGAGQAGSTNVAWNLAVGGEGGAGNRGGAVTVDRSGEIETQGDGSHAIFAQSVGGGGGTGGSARSISLFLKAPDATVATNSKSVGRELSFGGSGGNGGVGGSVNLTNVGNIATSGGDAHGIFAQSIGGGGGTGGNGHKGTNNLITNIDIGGQSQMVVDSVLVKSKGTKLNFGGIGGTGNDGGMVTVQQTGNITTLSDGSYGILAQSVGAGGGVGGNGIVDVDATGLPQAGFRLSGAVDLDTGSTNASGFGGAVSVVVDGQIETSGEGSHAIFAQSIGGGGGLAGNVERGLRNVGSKVGLDSFFQGDGGGGEGDGGQVEVESLDDIITHGSGASGIFAQSVGGGGGVAGNIGDLAPGEAPLNFAGSAGGVGSGKAVIVTQTGNITTEGMSAHGIFAQSSGGVGTGGAVNVSLNGQLVASGDGSDGIFAQSRGNNGNGNIAVNVVGGGIQGGSGVGAGVRLVDGLNNTLTNHGTISSLSSSAILGGNGNETVFNYGTVVGSVDLGLGNNTFNNYAAATLNLGAAGTVGLGVGKNLTNGGQLTGNGQITGNVVNSGTISPGNSAGSLSIEGTLNLLASSTVSLEIGGREQGVSYDYLSVSDFVSFLGTVSVSLTDNFQPNSSDAFTLMEFGSSSGGFDNVVGNRLLTVDNSGSFRVTYNTNSLVVDDYTLDTDGDGMDDSDEILAGTDWSDPQSVLAISSLVKDISGSVLIQFPRVAGKSYTIEYAADPGSAVWTEVGSPSFTYPDADTGQWIDDGTQTGGFTGANRFYRVKLLLPAPGEAVGEESN